VKLLEPIRAAGMPIHIGLGNHDNRERFWAAVPAEHRQDAPVKDKHVALIETERANWLMLDSLNVTLEIPGLLGADQLAWLARTLDARADKPALVMVHHNPPFAGRDPQKSGALLDTAALLDVLAPRKHAKVLFFGHSHRWSHEQRPDGLHLVNLPATAYVFDAGQPSGWVDARIQLDGATLALHTLDPSHPATGQKLDLHWRT
jgi:3',5'-cyclic AMP phosphodiesterase CpdA